jgi:hypothetical protein
MTVIECPRCKHSAFTPTLVSGTGHDTHVYLELRCLHCQQPALSFVVDMTPEIVRECIDVGA